MSGELVSEDRAGAVRAVMAAVWHMLGNPVLGAVVRHGVADMVGDGPVAADELARQAQLDSLSLTRTLRFLAAFGIFRETEEGRFAHTAASKLLENKPGGLRNYVFTKTSESQVKAMAGLAHAMRTGESSFAHVNGASRWEYLRTRPEENQALDAMFAEARGSEQLAVAEAYDWPERGTIVDVGGGNGSLMASILERRPHLSGVVVDQPQVIASAEKNLAGREVRSRCHLIGGSFFAPMAATGDIWLLSQVLHNWGDDDCTRILVNCRAAMQAGNRLLVIETITTPCRPDAGVALSDILMLANYGNARQRTEEEYRGLFARTGFRLTRVLPTKSAFSLIESVPA